jgi:hypothetical protein
MKKASKKKSTNRKRVKSNKFEYIKILGGIAIAYILFISYRKKTTPSGYVFVGQSNAPTGTQQVYSNVGTKIYDQNNNLIYTYDTANLGMTVTGTNGNKLTVIIGSDFANGTVGFVDATQVQSI